MYFSKGDVNMQKYSITGHSKLIDESNNIWGFVVEEENSKEKEILLSDNYFSSSIVIALDEIAQLKGKPEIKEGQKVKIIIETE